MEYFVQIGGEKGQLYQIVVIEVILLCLLGIPIGIALGSVSAKGILTASTTLISPEVFLVENASELKRLIAENSSLKDFIYLLVVLLRWYLRLLLHCQQHDMLQKYHLF